MGIFGWSYPPGCSSVPGDEPSWCEVCGLIDDCICSECPVCGVTGDPKCYREPTDNIDTSGHGLVRSSQQKLSKAQYDAADLKQQWQDAEQYVDYLKDQIK